MPLAAAMPPAAAATRPASTWPTTQSAMAETSAAGADARIQADWVRLMYLDEPGGVLEDTRAVFEAYPEQVWARRMYGWALLKTGRAEQAGHVLGPVAEVDPWSALGLAEALCTGNDRPAAQETLRTLYRRSPTGPAWRAAGRWSRQVGLELPGPQESQVREAQALLRAFDPTLLHLPFHASEFLQLKLTMDELPAAGEPWFGRIELTNTSNQPICCGADGALMPNVLISAMAYDPAGRDIGHRLLVSLFRRMVLAPKETVTLYRPLDTGPLREILRDPYRNVAVGLTAILDPVRSGERPWQAAPAGMVAQPVTADRSPYQPARGVDMLVAARSGSQAEKVNLARQIACIMVGIQRRSPAQTEPAVPPQATLTQAMSTLLQDADPLVAARALAQADYIPLIEPLARAAAPDVGANDWLVRLLAVRLFAHKQGEKFTRALSGMSTFDPDPLVRQLAGAYHAPLPKK
jgi:hypothetical protein